MKHKLTFAAFAIVAITLCVAPAHAQAGHPQHTATVPFAFTVGGVQLPAGTYAITQYGNRMQVRPVDGGKATIVTALPRENRKAADNSALHFERKGEGLILSDMSFAGTQQGIELLNNKARAASRVQ